MDIQDGRQAQEEFSRLSQDYQTAPNRRHEQCDNMSAWTASSPGDQGSTVTWSCSKGMLEYHKPSSTIININLSINLISWDCSSCPRDLLHRIAVKCPELKRVPSVLGRRKQTAPGSTGHLPCARRGMLRMWTSLQCSSNMSCTGEHVYGLSFQSVRCVSLQNRTIS